MAKELLEYYQRELALLYEQAEDFSAEFGGVADRLGGLTKEKMDPGLKGLLEGSAYLAARVQLKLKSEFSEFTTALIDQLLPNYLAPTPSSVLVQAVPNHENPNLASGLVHAAGKYIDATYVERERRVSCRYRLGGDLVIWPLRIEKAEYFAGPAPLQAMGLEVLPGTVAGLRLNVMHRTSNPAKDTPETRPSGAPFSTLTVDQLPIHLVGNSIDRDAIYEQLFAHCRRITLRYEDSHGDPQFVVLPLRNLLQLGFEETDALLPADDRSFYGFDLLREFFTFPSKFQGFRLHGLRSLFGKIPATVVDVLFEFDTVISRLASVVTSAQFALYAAPASNLFEMQCTRIPISRAEHEHQVVADRSRWLDYEVHRIVDVFAHYPGQKEKERVFPLYSLPTNARHPDTALYFTGRRLPRQPTAREKRFGSQTTYAGTETYVSLFEPVGISETNRVKELSVRAMVSNRHLTEQLPVGDTGADFRLADDTSVALKCIAGPTPPRDSIIHVERRQREATHPGPIMWAADQLPGHEPSGPRQPQHRGQGRWSARTADAVCRHHRHADRTAVARHRWDRQPADRPAAAAGDRLQRGARRRNQRDFRREGVRGNRRDVPGSGARPLLCRILVDQQLHRDRHHQPATRRGDALAAAVGNGSRIVSDEGNDVRATPERFDLFRVMRDLERGNPGKPRIGDSAVVSEDVVNLAQDPFVAYPGANVTALDETQRGIPRLHTRFLGFFGPQGALPLTTTLEAYNWWTRSDPSFTRFVDIFSNRFQQLFFRVWADARPIAQHDRPKQDRFARYVGSFAGIGSEPFADRDSVDDLAKLPFAGLVASRIKSARRLCQLIRGVFHLDVTITERIGSWLMFEPNDRMALGERGSSLGSDTFLGERSYSINDKFRVNIKTNSLEQYVKLLPNEPAAGKLADLIFFYLGHRFEYDVELALPARCAPGAQLGVFGQLGWTSWVAPPPVAADDERYLTDARFNLAERRRAGGGVGARATVGQDQ